MRRIVLTLEFDDDRPIHGAAADAAWDIDGLVWDVVTGIDALGASDDAFPELIAAEWGSRRWNFRPAPSEYPTEGETEG